MPLRASILAGDRECGCYMAPPRGLYSPTRHGRCPNGLHIAHSNTKSSEMLHSTPPYLSLSKGAPGHPSHPSDSTCCKTRTVWPSRSHGVGESICPSDSLELLVCLQSGPCVRRRTKTSLFTSTNKAVMERTTVWSSDDDSQDDGCTLEANQGREKYRQVTMGDEYEDELWSFYRCILDYCRSQGLPFFPNHKLDFRTFVDFVLAHS